MPMQHAEDTRTTAEIIQDISQAIQDNDNARFLQLNNELVESTRQELSAELEQRWAALQEEADRAAMAERGEKPLTYAEQKYYKALIEAMKAKDPQQAITNLPEVMPETVINRVMEDLRTRHPLLSKVSFVATGAAIRIVINTGTQDKALWGELCDEIVKEATAGFKVVQTNLLKLSAFLPVCKQGITFGPAYLDRYVRETLYEYIANGLEEGLVDGTGKDQPIGMTRQVGPGVTVVDGVYPRKEPVAVADFDLSTTGRLISLLATDDNGKPRAVRDLILLCNTVDYYAKVLPATQIMAPDGSYRSALPYNMTVIPVSYGLAQGEAILGMAYRYFAAAGADTDGIIEYSDHYRFPQDQRVYIIKAFANGFPMDNNAFLLLDISKLQPSRYKVELVESELSSDATLSALSLGAAAISPAFAAETTAYTAATANASNVVKATPADADAEIVVELNGTEIPNGSAAAWETGSNTLTVTVTSADGTATKTYTVTVTKS